MKKIIYSLLAVMFVVIIGSPSGSAAGLDDLKAGSNLSKEQIEARFAEINSKYKVGEPFSEADTAFIMKYAMKHTSDETTDETINPTAITNKVYSNTKSLSGVDATISGTCRIDHLVPFINSYDCNLCGRSNTGTVTVSLEHTAYGMVGEKVAGVVYSRTHTSQSGTRAANLGAANDYGAFVLWSYTTVRATVNAVSPTLGRPVTVEAVDS